MERDLCTQFMNFRIVAWLEDSIKIITVVGNLTGSSEAYEQILNNRYHV